MSDTWDSTQYDGSPLERAAAVVEENDMVDEADHTAVLDTESLDTESVDTVSAPTDISDTVDEEAADPIDALDDGSAAVGPGAAHEQQPSGTLAFALSAREQLGALPDPEVTGDARVDAATARLGDLAELPTSDHVGVYDDVHRRLQDALADAEVR